MDEKITIAFNAWATYKDDDRALTDVQKRRTNTEPILSPPQQDFFIEFAKPIFGQTVRYVNGYYSNYR